MRTKSTLLILLASLAAGCGDTPQMTPKEQALQNWNAARAGVTMNLAKDEYKNGDFDKARRDVDQALLMDPKNTNIHILSAKIAIEQNQLELADAELNAARTINPKLPEADYLSGVIYQRWEQPAKALIFYQHASEENPTELSYLMAKAETLVSLNRRDEALDLLQNKADYFEHNPVIHDAMGMICMQDRNFDKAVDMFRWAVILAPDDDNIREHLSLALYQDKRYGESAMNLQRLVKTDARSKRPDLFLALAECDLNTNHPAEARMAAQTACDLDPSQPIPWLTVARVSLQLGDLRRADFCVSKAVALDATSSQSYLLQGYLRVRQENFTAALDSFRQASQLDPTDTTSLCMTGYVLEKLDRHREATTYYQKALKIDPADPMATQFMATISGD